MTARIKGITEAAAIVAATLLLLGYCTPTPACDNTDCLIRELRDDSDRYERRERDLDLDRLQERMEEDVERANYRDRTLCQPAEDCRRTLWRRGYRR